MENSTGIRGACTGKNPTMKTLERGHGVSVGWIHEKIETREYNLIHTSTDVMAADIYTKAISKPIKLDILRKQVSVFTQEEQSTGRYLCGVDTISPSMTLNLTYSKIVSGLSSSSSDLRKPVKQRIQTQISCFRLVSLQ